MYNNERISDVIKTLIEQQLTISTMESCTSGLLASMITDTEGASAIFKGGFVTYSNEAKIQVGVEKEVIKQYGVYSKECAIAMAKVAKDKWKTDIAIGITGTTGNIDTNNSDSIEGKVFYCIIVKQQIHSFELEVDVSKMKRAEIKQLYARAVFEKLAVVVR